MTAKVALRSIRSTAPDQSANSYVHTREEIAKGILEGWCVRHDVAVVPAEGGWVHCPRSQGALARAYTTASEVVVEIHDIFGEHVIRLPVPKNEAPNSNE